MTTELEWPKAWAYRHDLGDVERVVFAAMRHAVPDDVMWQINVSTFGRCKPDEKFNAPGLACGTFAETQAALDAYAEKHGLEPACLGCGDRAPSGYQGDCSWPSPHLCWPCAKG